MKFPSLRLKENKFALLMAVDLTFNDLKNGLFSMKRNVTIKRFRTARTDFRTRSILIEMRVIRVPRPGRRRESYEDDDLPF